MSIFTLLVTLARELVPFLKEALMEGQPFRVWVRNNWLTFAWLVATAISTASIAVLSDHIRMCQREERRMYAYIQTLHGMATRTSAAVDIIAEDTRNLRAKLAEREREVTALQERIDQLERDNAKLKSRPPRRVASRPAPVTPPVAPPAEKRPSLGERIKQIFRRNK